MCVAAFRDVEAETCCQQSPAHVGECEEKQCTSTEGIDCPYGRPSEQEVDKTEAPGCEQRAIDGCAGLSEDRGAIEGDDVDTALRKGQIIQI